MKKIIVTLLTTALAGLSLPTQAQQLLYQWAFTNVTDTATNSTPTYATNAGTGVLGIGTVAGTTPAGTLTYFTNAGVGPSLLSTNPLVTNNAAGAYVCNGQSYSGSPSFVALATNLNLGEQPGGGLYKYTVTFWFQFGAGGSSGQFPRFVQFGAETNYDVGGKGVGNLEGVGTSINSFNDVQNGTGANPAGANPVVPVTGIFPGGLLNDGATWYFQAITYDGTQTTTNFITWLGTLTQPVAATAPQTENYNEIKFSTNATVLLGNDNVANTDRGLATGLIADVRIYQGVMSQSNLDLIRQFEPPNLTNDVVSPPVIQQQPASGSTYAGGSRTFSVAVTGNPSVFGYQWKSNNTTITGATNASYTLSNVTLNTSGSFTCKITNSINSTNSAAAIITVSTPPAGSFAALALSNNPYSFWLVNEASNSTVAISDYIRGNDGFVLTATNATYGIGPEAPGDPGFPVTNTDIGSVHLTSGQIDLTGPGTYPNTGMTMLGWIYNTNVGTAGAGVIFNLVSDTGGGFGLLFGGNNELDYQWGPNAPTAFASSGLDIPTNEWTFVALVISTNLTQNDLDNLTSADTNATLYVGAPTVGLISAEDSTAVTGDLIASGADSSTLALGRTTTTSSENGGFYNSSTMQFNQVAVFNSALSASTITNLYIAGAGIFLSGTLDPNVPGYLLLTYPLGTLQSANALTGPYTNVPSAVSPLYVPIDTTAPQVYYRVSYGPVSH